MMLSRMSTVSLLEPLASWLCSVGNLLTNVSSKIYYFLWDFYNLFQKL